MPFSQSLLLLREHGGSVVKVYVTDDDLATINQTFLRSGQARTAGKIFKWSSIQELFQDPLFQAKLKRRLGEYIAAPPENKKGWLIYEEKNPLGWKTHISWADLSADEQARCTLGRVNTQAEAMFMPLGMRRAPTTNTLIIYFSMVIRESQWNFNLRGISCGSPLGQKRRGNLTESLGRVWFHKDNLGE